MVADHNTQLREKLELQAKLRAMSRARKGWRPPRIPPGSRTVRARKPKFRVGDKALVGKKNGLFRFRTTIHGAHFAEGTWWYLCDDTVWRRNSKLLVTCKEKGGA